MVEYGFVAPATAAAARATPVTVREAPARPAPREPHVVDHVLRTLVQDDRLSWPDALSFGEPGWLYIAVNQLHRSPALNGGVEGAKPPFRIMRVYTGTEGLAGR